MMNTDEIARRTLNAKEFYDAGAMIEVNARVLALREEAELLGVAPRDLAAERMISLEASVGEDEPLSPDADLRRADLAMAAALVYLGLA